MQTDSKRFTKSVQGGTWSERLFQQSPAFLCIAGADGFFKQVNPAFNEKLGHTESVLLSQPFIEFIHPDDQQSTSDEVAKLSTGISTVHFENRFRHADGSYRWLLWNTTPVEEEGLLYATAIDITDRKDADQQYRQLLNSSPDSIVVMNQQGEILKVNRATESLFGYTPDELVGQSIEVLLPVRFHDLYRQHRDDYATDPQPRLMDGETRTFPALCKDGSEFPAEISLGSPGLAARVVICTVRDRSVQQQRERALDESRRAVDADQQQIKGLLTRLMQVEETERRRIARGLHDDVGQTLLAAKLSLDELLESDAPGIADSSMQEIQRLVNHAIKTTRTLSFELASAALYEVGVGAALQSECELAQRRSGIQFQPPEQLTGHLIPMEVKIILFRIGRELIRNIVKHSNARTAKLSLSLRDSELCLMVTDDGHGFDTSNDASLSEPTAGFGLFSINQQLDSISGRLVITSSSKSGTCAVVTIALDAMQELP